MSKSIKLSPKHGVNPTIGSCFYCGKDTGEIALLGRLKNDAAAPVRTILDYEPCDACKEKFKAGVLCVGVTKDRPADGRPPISVNDGTSLYPTGAYCLMRAEAVRHIFKIDTEAGGSLLLGQAILDQILENACEND